MLAFITAASIWRRRSGTVVRVDFSMIEAMLWTMAGLLLSAQLPDLPDLPGRATVYRCAGDDDWIAVEQPEDTMPSGADCDAAALTDAGVGNSPLARSADLVACNHLRERGFWDRHGSGSIPGLPWRCSFERTVGPAPELGADTDSVLRDVLRMPAAEIHQLRAAGALG
jgi:crotonobetainyl-CoA:carnitine CoA-transferase CaiB-like acyl-CoA transferase